MELRELEAFVQVATHGSFSRAAEALGTNQPALSRLVRRLEVELRQTLLVRNGRGAVPTPAGRFTHTTCVVAFASVTPGCADAQPNETDLPTEGAAAQPWEQQPGEPDNLYLAFVEYLKLGRARSKRAALEAATRAGVTGLPRLSTLRPVAGKWQWTKRAQAWDWWQAETSDQASREPWAQRLVDIQRAIIAKNILAG